MAKGGIKILDGVLTTSLSNWKVKKADLGREMIYYTGGAGPSQSVINNNDMYLMNWLKAHNVDFGYNVHPEFLTYPPDEQFYVIIVAGLLISYDRWGFVAEAELPGYKGDEDLIDFDQCSFDRIKTAIREALARKGIRIRRD